MNILEEVGVNIHCGACSGEYQVTLNQALLSHQMLHEGCPVSDERECPPLHWSRLVDEQLVHEFQNLWARLEHSAQKAGGELILLGKEKNGTGACHSA